MRRISEIKKGAILSYGGIFFNILAGLVYTPWMIKQLGKSDYGLYVLATAFLTYFIMDFGLGQTIARYISKYRIEGDETKINNLLGLTSKLYLYIDLVIFLFLLIASFFLENIFIKLTPEELVRFKIIFIIAGLFSILSFPFMSLNGVLIAYERFTFLKLTDLLTKVALVGLISLFLLLGYKLYALVTINAVIGICIIIIKLFYISKTTSVTLNVSFADKRLIKELVKFSLWITIIGVAQRLLMNITPAVLGVFSGTEQIAIFSIGMIIEGYTWTLANGLNGLFLPKVTSISLKSDNTSEISDLMIRVGRIQFYIIGLLIVGFVTLGREFFFLWMGQDYNRSYYVALLLILPGIITLTQEIAYTYLFVINELKYRAILSVSAAGFSLFISILLAPRFGAIGSAFAIFMGLILSQVIGMNIVYWKYLKLDIPKFFRECHLKLLLPLLISLFAGFGIGKLIPAHNLLTFAPKVILLGSFYLTIMWTMGFNKSESGIVKDLIKKVSISFK